MMKTLRKNTWLLRRSLLCTLTLLATMAWADTYTVTHSFADEELYGNKTIQIYFADLSATDIPSAATNVGLDLDLNADIRMTFVYDASKVTGTDRPRLLSKVTDNTRCLNFYGNPDASKRVRLVVSSPTGARIKSLRADGRLSTSYTAYATYVPSATNSVLFVDGQELSSPVSGATYSVNGTPGNPSSGQNYFVWKGDAKTLAIEKKTIGSWFLRSFTVEYEPDNSKALVPTITGTSNPFLTQSTVTIGSNDSNATYYYTTDGSTPTEKSARYAAPFTISKTTTVKAIALVPGKEASIVASATFEKINVRQSITDLNLNAASPTKEYIQLTKAVVTWVASDSIFIQDATTAKNAGLFLLNGKSSLKLQQGDQLTGIIVGTFLPGRRQLSEWEMASEVGVTVSKGGEAPVAQVTLADVASASTPVTYEDKDYLYQRVRLVTGVKSIGSALHGLPGATVVNALEQDETGVQIVLPATSPDIVVGGEYGFTGVLYEYTYVIDATTGFRTLHVLSLADVTSADGLALGSLALDSYAQRLVVGDRYQIVVTRKSHEAAISYTSSDESVATVDASGRVRAVGKGQATITVTLDSDGRTGQALQKVLVSVFEPVLELANGDFTEWEDLEVLGGYSWNPEIYTGSEPVDWNGYVGIGKGASQMTRNDDGSVHLTAMIVDNAHRPGLLTTASDLEIPLSDTNFSPQYNQMFVYATEATAAEFTGRPDALRVVLKGKVAANNARVGAVLFTPGTMAYPQTSFEDTELEGTEAQVVAIAEKSDIGSSAEWQELIIPFNYTDPTRSQRPAYALVSIVTNAAPATGSASTYVNDYLDVKSVSYVYSTQPTIPEATIGELAIGQKNVATFVAPDDVEFPDDVEAYIVEKTTADAAVLTPVSTAQKGEAVILMGTTGTYQLELSQQAEAHEGNLLHVSDGQNATGSDIYALGVLSGESEVAFHRYTGSRSLSAGRVFLKTGSSEARSLRIAIGSSSDDDDETTLGIRQPAAQKAATVYYDLQGRKAKAVGGIYVAGSKKVVIKK